jgi:hypothetical protein
MVATLQVYSIGSRINLFCQARNERPSWIVIVLAHWNNSPRVEISLHSDILFWFRANQSLLFLRNAACLAEKQQIPKYSWKIAELALNNNHSLTQSIKNGYWKKRIILILENFIMEKIWFFHDCSNETPQKLSRLPLLGAIF